MYAKKAYSNTSWVYPQFIRSMGTDTSAAYDISLKVFSLDMTEFAPTGAEAHGDVSLIEKPDVDCLG